MEVNMPSERKVSAAIIHILGLIDKIGYDKVSQESRDAYDALWALQEGLEGSPEDGSAIIFYTP